MPEISNQAYPFWMRETQLEKIRQILEKIPARGRVLDVACGPGFLEELITDKKSIVAIDNNPEYVEKVKSLGVDARVVDANTLNLVEKFDTIYAIDIIHLLDAELFFSSVKNIMKQDSILLLSVFCNEQNWEDKADWLKNMVKGFSVEQDFLVKSKNEWDFCLVLTL
jgi:SAM-dependent methyltransferase